MTEATKIKHELPADVSFDEFAHWLRERVCCKYSPKIMQPFWIDGWAYFTDGRLLIRLRCETLPASINHKRHENGEWMGVEDARDRPPKVEQVLGQLSPNTTLECPAVDGPDGDCNARWEHEEYCDECNGLGFRHCDMDHEHECIDCEGKGRSVVPAYEVSEPVKFEGREYQRFYLWIVSQMPGVKLSKPADCDNGMLSFRFEGGEGLLCSLADPFRPRTR